MNTLKLDKTGSWWYELSITPHTPAETIKMSRLIHTHSEYQTQFDGFIDDELNALIKSNITPPEKSVYSYLHVQEEVLVGHSNVCFVVKFIFGHDVSIHNFSDEFFKSFEERIVKYFNDYYIRVFGKFND